jgi:hypothetical protein
LKLSNKINGIIIIVVTIIVVIIGAYEIFQTSNILKQELNALMDNTIERLVHSLIKPLWDYNIDVCEELILSEFYNKIIYS